MLGADTSGGEKEVFSNLLLANPRAAGTTELS